MDKEKFISKRRTFKDAWAFILYLIYTIGCNSWLIMLKMESKATFFNLNYQLLSVLTISTLIIIILYFLMFAFFCEITMKASVFFFPIAQFVRLCLLSEKKPSEVYFAIFSIMFSIGVIYLYWRQIPVVSKVLSYTTRICLNHFSSCLFGIAICSLVQIFQIFITYSVMLSLDAKRSTIVLYAVFLNLFWTLANFSYFFKVYISSLVAFHFINSGAKVFNDSMKNAMYALGSISFGGLIMALIKTCDVIVQNERNGSDEDRNVFSKILMKILSFFFRHIIHFIEFANEFSMSYIAVHGCGYKEAVIESFKLIKGTSSIALGGLVLIKMMLGIFSLIMMCVTFALSYYIVGQNIKFDFNDHLFLFSFISTIVGCCVVYYVTMSTIVSSYLGLVFLYIEQPSLISDMNPDIASALQKPISDANASEVEQ
ncbi:hypothetical protein NBO_33gi001 [Nosema bombycis CQ1]|uniref:Protein PNS1 n=1 Tax=Nosema bombycis (strain CQ1 / CVCC 102059) TaxID=578461 RepID=R0M8B1_NOSB1|nr:hypothetical protein NBO_33gi001 [Nosema bombycis CQ1]|eukprot:EOB14224.1 hypothetical protein NBO_33gi001 [Nosema bombycis CQ1]